MAMAVDNRQQQQSQMGALGYDPMRYTPQFTNPWASSPAPPSGQLYPTSLAPSVSNVSGVSGLTSSSPSGAQVSTSNVSIPPYQSIPVTTAPMGTDMMNRASFSNGFSQSASPNIMAPTSAPYNGSSPYSYQQQMDQGRRPSFPISNPADHRGGFSDALDASRGMVAMSQDLTPRNIYGTQGRTSTDSYGFPSTYSTASSISSASTHPSYYSGSVADSVTDYSSASESIESMANRTLPRPNALVGTSLPPAPQSMMGQFSSKVSSSSQKKHKCKICDKRFTRPSSLQTHMYSHTGEKPFACEVEGCGRHFSVVSNLRRHRKVHKNEGRDQPSPEEM